MSKIKFRNSDNYITVQNVFCVGKNYADHVKEMSVQGGNADLPKEPVIFLKTNSSVIQGDCTVKIPEFKGKKISSNIQNELELVILMGDNGENIPLDEADNYIAGYSVGIDFTLRDLQTEAKLKGLPWSLSKSFIKSAPVSEAVGKEEIKDAENLNMVLKVNNKIIQQGNTSNMIFKINYIINYISSVFGIKRGDLIFTGTPSGVTKLTSGDIVEAYIDNIGGLNIKIG